jgi:hypothetical protein
MRSTQLERYSRSPGQHDLSVQTRRLKRPLMAKVWLPKLWASTIPSICTCGRSNSGQVARTYGPGDASYADKSEIRQIMFQGCFRILSSFPRKPINTKVGDNFVAHNMDTEFALFGVRTWEIWCQQGRAVNQGNLDEADFMEIKFPSLPRKIWCMPRWSTPQGSPRVWIQPLGALRGWSIHPFIRETPRRRRSDGRKLTVAASPRVA